MKNTFKDSLLLSFDSAQDDGVEIFSSIVSATTQNAWDNGVEIFPSIMSATTQNAWDDGEEIFPSITSAKVKECSGWRKGRIVAIVHT